MWMDLCLRVGLDTCVLVPRTTLFIAIVEVDQETVDGFPYFDFLSLLYFGGGVGLYRENNRDE